MHVLTFGCLIQCMQTPCAVSHRWVYPFGGPLWITVHRYCVVECCIAEASEFLESIPERLSNTSYLCSTAKQLIYQLGLERQLNWLIRQGEDQVTDLLTQRAIDQSIARQFDEERFALEIDICAKH